VALPCCLRTWRAELASGALLPVLPAWRSAPFELFAVLPPAPRVPVRARRVVEALADYCRLPPERWGEPAP